MSQNPRTPRQQTEQPQPQPQPTPPPNETTEERERRERREREQREQATTTAEPTPQPPLESTSPPTTKPVVPPSGGGGLTQNLIGAISSIGPASEQPADGLRDAASAMLTAQVDEAAGVDKTSTSYAPQTAPEYVEDEEAAERAKEFPMMAPGMYLGPDRFRAEKAQPLPPPGETERGWSPEVVARHPEVMAATMAEIAGSGNSSGGPSPENIDPTDMAALQGALREMGFTGVRMTDLKNKAIRLAATRLAQIQEAYANSGVHAQMAADMAIRQAEAAAESGSSAVPEDVAADTAAAKV